MVSISTGADSKQDYRTPRDFMQAHERRFGKVTFDLAADCMNAQAARYYALEGDPFAEAYDSLAQDWNALELERCWLNPEFRNITPWAVKCADTTRTEIHLLTPASVGANWFANHVWQKAYVIFLNGRLEFDGVNGYGKDCMLSVFGRMSPGVEIWDWRKDLIWRLR